MEITKIYYCIVLAVLIYYGFFLSHVFFFILVDISRVFRHEPNHKSVKSLEFCLKMIIILHNQILDSAYYIQMLVKLLSNARVKTCKII